MTKRINPTTRRNLALALTLLLSISGAVQAQQAMKLSAEGVTGQPYTLAELGAIIVQKDDKLETLMVMPMEHRLKAYRSVDIQQGDVLVMLNGKRLKEIDALKAVIDSTAVGETLKFGVRRGEDMMIISFAKASREDLPQMRTMIKAGPGDGGEDGDGGFKSKGVAGRVAMLSGSGIVARESEANGVVVMGIVEGPKSDRSGAEPHEGDRILSLQGEPVKSLEDLDERFAAIADGETVTLVLSRDGAEQKLTFTKAKSGGMMMIKK